MLVWLEGQPLYVPMPQNHHMGGIEITGARPVFMSGSAFMSINIVTEDRMLRPRLRHFELYAPIPPSDATGNPIVQQMTC